VIEICSVYAPARILIVYGLPSFGRALIAAVTVPYSQGPGVLETTYAVDAAVEEQAAALDDTLAGDEAIDDADSVEELDKELETVNGATDEDSSWRRVQR
jgi:hypothetical protein